MEHVDGYTFITVVKYHILFIPPIANIWNDSDAGTTTKIHLCYQIMWVVAWNLLVWKRWISSSAIYQSSIVVTTLLSWG